MQSFVPRPGSPSDIPDHHMFPQMQSESLFGIQGIPPDYHSDLDSQKHHHASKLNGFPPSSYRTSFTSFPNANRSRHHPQPSILTSNSYREPNTAFYPSSSDILSPQLTSPTLPQMQSYDSRSSFDLGSGGQSVIGNGIHKQSYNHMVDPYGPPQSASLLPSHLKSGAQQHQPHHVNGFGTSGHFGSGGVHISSQTPYGPHIATSGPVLSGSNMTGNVPPGLSQPGGLGGSSAQSGQQEDISTIFVVGFPDDMQEREFQNMFTFSSGFEAATLKIPNKDYNAYGGRTATGSFYGGSNDPYNLVTVNQGGVLVDGGRDGTMTSWPAPAPLDDGNGGGNDPGSRFPGARANPQHSFLGGPGAGLGMPPRKQIIGFAKFRTREEALAARDVLQGKRVDFDKGAVLKAEMAKKNLHTKRGPSSNANGATNAAAGSQGLGMGLANNNGTLNVVAMNGVDPYGLTSDGLGIREREVGSLNIGRLQQWRDAQEPAIVSSQLSRDARDEEERRREREFSGLGGMGLPVGVAGTRGPRERAEEEERERRRKEKDQQIRLRSGNSAAFDAFHSLSSQPCLSSRQQLPPGTIGSALLSPPPINSLAPHLDNAVTPTNAISGTSPMLTSGFANQNNPMSVANLQPSIRSSMQLDDSGILVGPWDNVRKGGVVVSTPTQQPPTIRPPPSSPHRSESSNTNYSSSSDVVPGGMPCSHAPSPPFESLKMTEQSRGNSETGSCSSSIAGSQGGGESKTNGDDGDGEVSRAISGLAVSTNSGDTSPQLPSPASGASSGGVSVRNGIDQNPPINTLYVGNLPTSPPPMGVPPDILEESLKELFKAQPGFKRFSFKQKSTGPMCFVEFEDVPHAAKTIQELNGHAVNGLVKGGGIRLSYSKNPLGVRTPTSAANSSVSLQLQQQQGFYLGHGSGMGLSEEQGNRRNDMASLNYFSSAPPPRFISSASLTSFGLSSSGAGGLAPLGTNGTFHPRSNNQFIYNNVIGMNSPFSPFASSMMSEQADHDNLPHHLIPRAMSPSHGLEAARAA